LIIAAALPPIPPETERGAGVFAFEPMRTPDWKVDVRTVFPLPPGVRVKLPFPPVAMVRAPESLKLLAESVCVAPLIERPLIVLAVCAVMPPPRLRLLASERFPVLVRVFAFEKKLILPVDALPSCKVCLFVVPRIPVPVRKAALLPDPAEIEAVGTPPATLVKANLADAVAVLPSRRSSVCNLSTIVLFASVNGDPPLLTGSVPITSVGPPARFTAFDERTPLAFE